MRDTIRIRASLAVLLVDDFTGKLITSPSVRVMVAGGKKPVRKQEGFYVFTNLADSPVRLIAEGPCYYRQEQTVSLKEIDAANPVLKIRMLPDRTCPLPEGTIRLTAVLPEETGFLAFYEAGRDYMKLLSDYKEGSGQICLYQTEKEELEGKGCRIAGKDGQWEFFRLGRRTDMEKGEYKLVQALKSGYKKIGTRVYPVSAVYAQEEREWFLPLKSYGNKETEYTCIMRQKGQQTEKKVLLQAGKENRLNLR